MNYYNDFDPKVCAWLEELIRSGLIPPGDVDTRSISEIEPYDLNGYTRGYGNAIVPEIAEEFIKAVTPFLEEGSLL